MIVQAVPCSEGHGRRGAVHAGQNRRRRTIPGSRYASRRSAVRSDGRWNHLSAYDEDLFLFEGTDRWCSSAVALVAM